MDELDRTARVYARSCVAAIRRSAYVMLIPPRLASRHPVVAKDRRDDSDPEKGICWPCWRAADVFSCRCIFATSDLAQMVARANEIEEHNHYVWREGNGSQRTTNPARGHCRKRPYSAQHPYPQGPVPKNLVPDGISAHRH
jgi:hypothetical protein